MSQKGIVNQIESINHSPGVCRRLFQWNPFATVKTASFCCRRVRHWGRKGDEVVIHSNIREYTVHAILQIRWWNEKYQRKPKLFSSSRSAVFLFTVLYTVSLGPLMYKSWIISQIRLLFDFFPTSLLFFFFLTYVAEEEDFSCHIDLLS